MAGDERSEFGSVAVAGYQRSHSEGGYCNARARLHYAAYILQQKVTGHTACGDRRLMYVLLSQKDESLCCSVGFTAGDAV